MSRAVSQKCECLRQFESQWQDAEGSGLHGRAPVYRGANRQYAAVKTRGVTGAHRADKKVRGEQDVG